MLIKLIARFVFLCVIASTAAAAETSTKFMQGLNDPIHETIYSSQLKRSFHAFVRLPREYYKSKNTYPVIYLLDGGHTFPMLASYFQYLSFGGEIPEAIIVGLSYGNDDWRQGNFRSTDFTAPTPSRDHYGGASTFLDFFSKDLFPVIEEKYRIDSSNRILFGQSLGGQFVLFAAHQRPALFHGYIASNPALHRNLEFFMQALERNDRESLLQKAKLYVSSGAQDDDRFRLPALRWMEHWNKKYAEGQELPWLLRTESLEGQGHFSAAPQAFRKGLQWILKSKE